MKSPAWLNTAFSFVGVKEIPGPKHNSVILGWLDKLHAWWHDDETPWCGVFVAYVMKMNNIEIPGTYMRAKSWLSWGNPLSMPVLGCVVVFDRAGGGHVGFVVGKDPKGNLFVLGGNQNDQVKVSMFRTDRVAGYRYPKGSNINNADTLPVMANGYAKESTNEA